MALREHLSQRRDEYKGRFAQFSAMTEGAEAETLATGSLARKTNIVPLDRRKAGQGEEA